MTRLSARRFRFRAPPRPIRLAGRSRLAVESLEDRTVPAGGLVDNLVIFGDSLSDVGNAANANLPGYDPYHQYWQGRASNGPMWVETLAEYLGEPAVRPSSAGGLDYAVVGATVAFDPPEPRPYPWYTLPRSSIPDQVGEYLADHDPTANDLFVVFGGANDLSQSFSPAGAFNPFVTAATLVGSVQTLYNEGARQFVVPNLPPLGETPLILRVDLVFPGARAAADQWTAAFNFALATDLAAFRTAHSDATVVGINSASLFQQIARPDNPFGFVNWTDPVGPLVSGPHGELAGFYLQEVTAPDAENYFFYDGVHPTTKGHQLIGLNAAAKVYEALGVNGLGVTGTADAVNPLSGDLTLREMVNLANAMVGEQTITFDLGQGRHRIGLSGQELSITDDLTIDGPGAKKLAVSGNDASRVFDIGSGAGVTIEGMTITRGLAAGNDAPVVPSCGGGILNFGDLTLSNVVVSRNRAIGAADAIPDPVWGPGVAAGGGVYNRGTLTVTDSAFIRNQSVGASGSDGIGKYSYAGAVFGGGLANTGTATITDSRFTGNLAQGANDSSGLVFAGVAGGGAISSTGYFVYATLDVSGSSFTNNRAVGGNDNTSSRLPGFGVGGAIFSHRFSKGAVLHFKDSTVAFNLAMGGNDNQQTIAADPVFGPDFAAGGGIFIAGRLIAGRDDTINTVSGSTFDHNQAVGGLGRAGSNGGEGHGGAIGIGFAGTVVEVSNSTVGHNLAVGGQAGAASPGLPTSGGNARGGGIFNEQGAVLTVTENSLVDHNQALGGSAAPGGPASNGGSGLGGGLYNDAGTSINVTDSSVTHDLAVGAAGSNGGNGGNGQGGGLYNSGDADLIGATITRNKAQGGAPGLGGLVGLSQGGGVYNAGSISVDSLTVISDNDPDDRFGF